MITACLWVGWAPMAEAKKPKPDPAADLVALDREEALACASDTPEGFQIHTGYDQDPDQVLAIEGAIRSARRTAIGGLCAGRSESKCAIVRRHLEGWKSPFFHPHTHRACAHVGVNRQWLDSDAADQARLSADLRTLAEGIAAAADGALIWIAPPTWEASGCHAGDVGTALVAEIRNGLGAIGGIRLADEGQRGTVVQITLSVSGPDVVLAATLQPMGSPGRIPVQGFRFSDGLFELGAGGGDCRFDKELGLADGQRGGAGGRTVRVSVPASGSYCEGDRVTPYVQVDRPSRVRVFSVDRAGLAYLVWPPPGADDLVTDVASLGEMELFLTQDGGDEKLLAVAMDPADPLGPLAGWEAFCRVPLLSAASYPADAALGAATFQVRPFDADACLVRGIARQVSSPIPKVPVCGGP